jgi:hypothetical protein
MGELSTRAVTRRYNRSLVSQISTPNLRTRLQRIALKSTLALVGAGLLAFTLDYAVFRIRVATSANPYGSVVVSHYTAVLQKNGKTTFTFDPPQPWTCVNALFPHAGSLPCWYLSRHPEQRTDI